jgi:hypothetical protein
VLLILFIICIGTPTIPNDSRNLYLFSAKILFYESFLYTRLDYGNNTLNHFLDIVFSKPKLAATLSASFAKLLGFWNETLPKTTNIILILPPMLFLMSTFKDKLLSTLWIFLVLFFSGKLLINGLMDGVISLYFVSNILLSYMIIFDKNTSDKKLLYFLMFLFFSILSLTKNEGAIMLCIIITSTVLLDFLYKNKPNLIFLSIGSFSLFPLILWKLYFYINNIKMEFLQFGSPIDRFISRVTNLYDLKNIVYFLLHNEKLIIALILFIICSTLNFKKEKKLIYFILFNFALYFLILMTAIFLTPHTVLIQLEQSSVRIFIPLVLVLSYFSLYLIKSKSFFVNKDK